MLDLLYVFAIIAGFATAYVISLFSLAVYVDPEEVEKLSPNQSARRRGFVKKLANDPLALVQSATVYKSFALIIVTVAMYQLLPRLGAISGWPTTVVRLFGMLLTWLLYIFFVEYMPRRSAAAADRARLLRHLWLVGIIYFLFFPLVGRYRRALQRIRPPKDVTGEDKEDLVERALETLAEQAGIGERILEEEKKEMIGQIFQLDQTVAREIMIPRIDIVGIEKSMTFPEIRRLVMRDGHSRYPVYEGSIDRILGLAYVKDMFNHLPEPGEEFRVTDHMRKAYFIPGTKVIGELLREFKHKRMHIAVVVDEYGGVSGLVTLEDIIEEIFGEIRDEHDWEQEQIVKLTDGAFLVNAGLLVEDLQDFLDTDFEQSDYDTVGGLIYDLVGSVPREGQVI
ncbi:MAG TPA: hemolysin family protein, partial [candidate division Zixibacteria bacterium]|nr:hemolysin family protein [candidate division Zixibacteria bacterium]